MNKILIADDHVVLRTGLKTYIQHILPHAKIDEASDGEAVIEMITKYDYALIVLDIQMNETNTLTLIGTLLAINPDLKILMYSMSSEQLYAKKYLELGALGYLNKNTSTDEIKTAIYNIMNNKRYLSPSLTAALVESALRKNPERQNPFERLSPREVEITKQLIKGESVTTISENLHIHTSTVGSHKARIFKKLKCNNIIEIVELAVMYKLS